MLRCSCSLVATVGFLLTASHAFAVDIPKADLEAAKKRPVVQQGRQPFVIEGVLEQPGLKDVPMPRASGASDAHLSNVEDDAAEILKDVEILTGISPSGFDLPFVVQNLEVKR